MKISAYDLQHIKDISSELNNGLKLIMSDRFELMTPTSMSSTDVFTASYYPDKRYSKITKQYGHALVPMFSAIKSLDEILTRLSGEKNA